MTTLNKPIAGSQLTNMIKNSGGTAGVETNKPAAPATQADQGTQAGQTTKPDPTVEELAVIAAKEVEEAIQAKANLDAAKLLEAAEAEEAKKLAEATDGACKHKYQTIGEPILNCIGPNGTDFVSFVDGCLNTNDDALAEMLEHFVTTKRIKKVK